MKRINIIITGIVFLTSLAITEKVWSGIDINIRVGNSAREQKINVVVGEEFTIALPASRTQGYAWQLEKTPGDEIRLINITRCTPKDRETGYCTDERWVYQAIDKGKTTIKFRLVQPGDPDHPIDRLAYKIHVHD